MGPISRRRVLVGATAGAGVAWAAPAILTLERAVAGSAPACQVVHTINFSQKITQDMVAPKGAGAWNNRYGWTSKFRMDVSDSACTATATVRIKVNGTITDAQKAAWRASIMKTWSGQFKLCCVATPCCPNGYTINADLAFTGEDQTVTATGADVNSDMGHWRADGTDINHEYGHMLGNPDEYFNVNGTDFGAGRQPRGNVMNNPANAPAASHYAVIATAANQALAPTKSACAVTAPGKNC